MVCVGRTWTSPGPRTTRASPMGIPRRAERARPSACSSRSRWTSRTGACRQQTFERELIVADQAGYDIVILGGGSGGYACALRAAELADHARDSASFGVKTTLEGIDMAGVNGYKDKVVTRLWRGLVGLIGSRHIDVIDGEGRLVSPTQVQVGDTLIEGAHVVLATGSESRSLPGIDIDGQRVITSDQALELDRVPASAIILGGGVIGVEFASIWRSFGAEVTIVEMLPHLLPPEDESSSKLLERAFRRRGIGYKLGARFESVKPSDAGVTVTLEGGTTLDAELLLVAVGRGPVSAGLGYEDAGVATDRGFVTVDEYCRTSVPTISAVGDLIPGPQLAHVGFAEGIMVAERLAELPVTPIDYDGVPRVTYSDPEVASVGITSAVAAERGIKTTEVIYDLAGNGKSQILQTGGAAKVIATEGGGPVLGIHLVGARVGELIAEAHLALAGKPLHFHS